jgi:hypothetical protein
VAPLGPDHAQQRPGSDPVADPDRGGHRLDRGPEAVVVQHRQDGAVDDDAREGHRAGARRAHGGPDRCVEVDPAMAGRPPR